MKKLIFLIYILATGAALFGQNIPRANHSGPYGVQVNTFTGNLYMQRTDLVIPNQGLSIDLSFSYNSYQDTLDLGYGKGWTCSYAMSYERDTLDAILLYSFNGRRDRYKPAPALGLPFVRPVGFFDRLIEYEADKFVKTDKYGIQHFFDDPSHSKLTRIEDTNGNTITMDYEDGNPVLITDASGRSVRLIWREGHLAFVEDNNGSDPRRIEYRYDNGGRLVLVKDPLGNNRTYTYNSRGTLSGMTDENSNEMTALYDKNKAAVTLGSCRGSTKFEYDPERGITYVQDANESGNQLTTYLYDEEGKLIRKTGSCCGFNTSYTYDDDRNVSEMTDANGQVFRSNYDEEGNVVRTSDPLGHERRFVYTSELNRMASFTDERGNSSQFTYDEDGNLTQLDQPEGVQLQMGYDGAGNIASITDGNSQTSTLVYNSNNDLTNVQYPIGSESFTYDGVGNLLSSTDANNNTVIYEYDRLDRLTAITDPLDNRAEFAYDAASNLTQETDPNDNVKTYTYDEHHRLAAVTTPTGITNYLYDARDNLTGIVDANQNVTSFQYDKRNLLVMESDPLGHTTQYSYDGNGNVFTRTDANGRTTEYTYDALNRLVRKQYEGNTDNYEYDAAGNLIRASNKDISLRFTYDGLNRLTNKLVENWGKSISYTYDANGNRLTMTDPEGGVTYYTYDANNRLKTLTNPSNQLTEFTYDDAGRMTRQDNANGTYALYTYDAADRVLSIQHRKSNGTLFAGYTYTYDANGNRLSMEDSNNGTSYYTYDGDNRLTRVEYGNGDVETYTFDGKGNRLTKTLNGVITDYTYDAADRIQTAGDISYGFDGNGNMVLKSDNGQITHYDYDGEDRLVEVTLPNSEVVAYQYDPFGNRIVTIDGQGEVTRYFHDLDNVLMEMDESGSVLVRYTSGLEMDYWVVMERSGTAYTYHQDGTLSIRVLTDTIQEIAKTYSYTAYGEIQEETGNIENAFAYTGRERESESQLYYYRSRFYDSVSGRFLNKDQFSGTLENPLSANRYIYAENNPIIFIDPEGTLIQFALLIPRLVAIGRTVFKGYQIASKAYKGYKKLKKALKFSFLREIAKTPLYKSLRSTGIFKLIRKANRICRKAKIYLGKKAQDVINKSKKLQELQKRYKKYKEFEKENELGYLLFDELTADDEESDDESNFLQNRFNKSSCVELIRGIQNIFNQTLEIKKEFEIVILRAIDPNEIAGPTGYGPEKWVSVDDELPYTIYFENDPDYATAPAQRVVIRHAFDEDINPYSLRLGDFGFGNFVFEVPDDRSQYRQRLDLRDSLGIFLDFIAGVDITNNEAFWIFESIDPETGLLTTLPPDVGFLPVNDTTLANGEGFVNFRVQPRSDARTGDEIQAQARIFFDEEAPIETNIHTNRIDAGPPVSSIANLPAEQQLTEIELQFTGQDDPGGVGVAAYDLYVARDGGPFGLHAESIDDNTYLFQVDEGGAYAFYVEAVDHVGNREQKDAPEQSTVIDVPKRLTLYRPAGGEVACEAGSLVIEWRASTAVSAIDIYWSLDGGGNYELLAGGVDASQEFYYHAIPFNFGTYADARVRVQDSADGSLVSELGPFAIAAPDQTNLTQVTCDPAEAGVFNRYLTNQYGCDSIITTTVVWDDVPPVAGCAATYSVALGADGQASLAAAALDQGSTDNCAGWFFSFDAGGNESVRVFECADIGQQPQTLWVTDAAGNQESCTVQLTVTDAQGQCVACDGSVRTINDDPIPSDLYAASVRITSAGRVAGNGVVTFQAAEQVVLLSGFRVNAGGRFRARIGDCTPAAALVAPPTVAVPPMLQPQLRIFPNPFTTETTIRYRLPAKDHLRITVTDIQGRVVAVPLPATEQEAGVYDVRFSGAGLAPGVYQVRLEGATTILQERVVLGW